MAQNRTIYKYPLKMHGMIEEIKSFQDAHILSAGYDPSGVPCVWALVNPQNPPAPLKVLVMGTGWDVDFERYTAAFIATLNDGPFMWHVWQIKDVK